MRIIKGEWVERGFRQGRGQLLVEITPSGLIEAEWGMPLTRMHYRGDPVTISNGVWEFWPDDSELTRLGIVPVEG